MYQSSKGDLKSIKAELSTDNSFTELLHSVDTSTPPSRRHSGAGMGSCEICDGPCKLVAPVNGPKPRRTGVVKKVTFKRQKKITEPVKRRLSFNSSEEPAKKFFKSSFGVARSQVLELGQGKLKLNTNLDLKFKH